MSEPMATFVAKLAQLSQSSSSSPQDEYGLDMVAVFYIAG